ncbi:hypothetical protein [Actinoplanes sp. HUAS TT8]|uniref:hypothetical protein n=1 Tax=Actinoplanes sp. HUAS TT8 TaxID=3447453 RepID=UPI003F5242BB
MTRPVPNTITDQQMADLRRRAEKVAPPLLSNEATRRRLASSAQQAKADRS